MSIGIRLTRQGKRVLAQGLLGNEIHFTRVGIGSGGFDYDTEKVYDVEELREFQMWLPIVKTKIIGDGTVYVKAYLSNAEVTKGFPATEHGVFAIDQETGEEILYGYKNVGEEYDFIPANTGSAFKNVFVSYIVEIQDAENITATLDLSVAYINTQDFEAHINSTAPHPNTPTKLDDVATTTEIWSTDNDSHLHKISVENLREILKDDTEKQSAQDIITAAQNELGLVSNILMIEDFTDDVVTDYFVSKVNSAAEHGNLLGIENPQNLRTGGRYVLSDGVNAELVQIASILKNASGYYAKLAAPIANTYILQNLKLYRTTLHPCEKKTVTWNGAEFSGIRANFTRTVELENYYDIQGDGFFDGEFFTLG